jgi:hypothetical protein
MAEVAKKAGVMAWTGAWRLRPTSAITSAQCASSAAATVVRSRVSKFVAKSHAKWRTVANRQMDETGRENYLGDRLQLSPEDLYRLLNPKLDSYEDKDDQDTA